MEFIEAEGEEWNQLTDAAGSGVALEVEPLAAATDDCGNCRLAAVTARSGGEEERICLLSASLVYITTCSIDEGA